MKKEIPVLTVFILFLFSCTQPAKVTERVECPVSDVQATPRTKELMSFLSHVKKKGIMIGHQDGLLYGNSWFNIEGWSDVKRATHDYPAVAGYDFGKIETDADINIDSVPFSIIKNKIIEGYKKQITTTISWHVDNPLTGGGYNDTSTGNTVAGLILPSGNLDNKFKISLDRLSDFLCELKDDNGIEIPVILRLFMSGNCQDEYWWSISHCSPEEYKSLWRKTVEYIRSERNIHHVLYAYSIRATDNPDELLNLYPGNEYIDIIGVNYYFPDNDYKLGQRDIFDQTLAVVCDFAEKHKKIPALTETGMEGIKTPNYFTGQLYPILSKYELSYVLFWRNAWNMEEHYYVPIPGHPAVDDFVNFTAKSTIFLREDIKEDYIKYLK
ncbi:mannan endo-1,4-beta-mannosidase [Dysgonomonas hofstadii]|uniref:Mannan endo-1,4-beta-mannosidase n=1 Tax=Dysgonomonas hofstadii TaxID=637886 RepID=A0A840CL25_9BACT|nr:glycosyl hydrolase [Dysgonomonas hofstadii]MBB4035359.1 mannan endo-1,4-beta-mannosidase [Dysgonomonas hofstadii]